MPMSAMPHVRPDAARGTAKYTNAHAMRATFDQSPDSARRTSSRRSTVSTYSRTTPPIENSTPMTRRSTTNAAKRVTMPA